jgi:hypothetical protein
VNRSATVSTPAITPSAVVTRMFLAPVSGAAGDVAVIWLADSTVKAVAGPASPKVTLVTSVNPVPLITTSVPPLIGPADGATRVITGV